MIGLSYKFPIKLPYQPFTPLLYQEVVQYTQMCCTFTIVRVASVRFMEELVVKTTKTKVRGNTHLFARTFQTERKEAVISLLRVDGKERESDDMADEWAHTVERTLVNDDLPAYERLENALKELNGLLKGTQIGNHLTEISALLALQDAEGVLHMSQAGSSEGYLVRGGKTVQITERPPSRGDAQFLYISSGDIERDDVVLLSTDRLLRCMTPAQIAAAARKRSTFLEAVRDAMEAEKEIGIATMVTISDSGDEELPISDQHSRPSSTTRRRGRKKGIALPSWARIPKLNLNKISALLNPFIGKGNTSIQKTLKQFSADLSHPKRKKKAHLLLLASALVVFIAIWSAFQLTTVSRKSQGRSELKELVTSIEEDITTAENRQLMGDIESANAVLSRAEQAARSVMQNESGLFRTEALDLLDRIREKREAISNIVRLSPTIVANLTSRNPNVSARGLIGIERGRMIVFDRQNLYSIIVNAVDEPQRLDGDNLILNGTHFGRYNTNIFMTKENRLIELIEGQPTAMKTDDPAGWLTGPDLETYIRFLYILSPQNNQILKYERLSNRYSEPGEYNVNGNLTDAIDMSIDANVYVLHPGGKVTKLFRGEERPFTVRNLPEGDLDHVTKIFKVRDRGNFYFLDPENARVIVSRTDDDLGESLYLKQYVLEGEQVGKLQDLYVDLEETQLIVLDEKRVYSINLQEG